MTVEALGSGVKSKCASLIRSSGHGLTSANRTRAASSHILCGPQKAFWPTQNPQAAWYRQLES
eukprot:6121870-Pleurochrysis_carterae.AAC.1